MKKIGLYLLGEKAYKTLEEVVNTFSSEVIAFVVLAKDKNVHKDFYEDIRKLCEKHSIDYYHRKDSFSSCATTSFAIGWKWIINNDSLIVFHDSILPKYRGFSPLVNMLINGEEVLGVTALKAVSEYDKGPIICQKTVQIDYPIKIQEAINTISPLYAALAIEIINKIINNIDLPLKCQDEMNASYSLWRNEDDYQINWNQSSEDIQRFVDAVGFPFKGASTYLNGGEKLRIKDVSLYQDVNIESRNNSIGKVIFMDKKFPIIVCGKGLIRVNSICSDTTYKIFESLPFRSRLT